MKPLALALALLLTGCFSDRTAIERERRQIDYEIEVMEAELRIEAQIRREEGGTP